MESQFAMCRNNSCAPPIGNFANVYRLVQGENFLTRDRLLNLSNKLLRSYPKVIAEGNDPFIYVSLSCAPLELKEKATIVYTYFSIYKKIIIELEIIDRKEISPSIRK